MRSAFAKDLFHSITGSMGRFLAILGIVALGCGFFVGLNMTGRDMRYSADNYYDATQLYDIRLISSMGLTQDQVDMIQDVEGVKDVMPTYSTDAMASLNSDQYVVRISALPEAAPLGRNPNAKGYLNQIDLIEGRWPQAPNECVMSYDRVMREDLHIGDTIAILYGSTDLDNVLTQKTFTVVGLVRDADYVDQTVLGTTTLGGGSLEQYLYVPREAFSDSMPYTQVYVTVEGADQQQAYSDGYDKAVEEVEDRLRTESPELAASRLSEIQAEAQKQVDDARNTYNEQAQSVQDQLDQGQQQLDQALDTLSQSSDQLRSSEDQLAQGRQELEQRRAEALAQLDQTRQQLSDAQAQLDAAQAQVGITQDDVTSYEQQVAQGRAQTAQARATIERARADLGVIKASRDAFSGFLQQTGIPTEEELEQLRSTAQSALRAADDLYRTDLIDPTSQDVQDQVRQVAQQVRIALGDIDLSGSGDGLVEELRQAAQTIVDDIIPGTLNQLDDGLAQGTSQLDSAEAELRVRQDQLDQAQSALNQINQGRIQLAQGWEQYTQQSMEASRQLAAAEQQLSDSTQQLLDGSNQITQGYADTVTGLTTLADQRLNAAQQLADGAQQLQNAQNAVNSIQAPNIYVLDRDQGVGQLSYGNDASRMDRIAGVFPLFFFLVAALVALTTMTRMVESDRVELGTLKALGYSTMKIASKYLIYALLASTTGAVIGILFLSQFLPYVIMNAYGIMYVVPLPSLPLPIDPGLGFGAGAAGVGITLIATLVAVWVEMKQTPASLMVPEAPKPGKRILLERIKPLWAHVSFLWKVTLRNIFRYKRRLVMTIVGIAGCTALLLTGLSVRNAVQDIINNQFGDIMHYNLTLGFRSDATDEDKQNAIQYLEDTGHYNSSAWGTSYNMQAGTDGHDPEQMQMIVPEDTSEMSKQITMRERVSKRPVEFDDNSVLVTEKMATNLGLHVGDTVQVYQQDEIGNATGDGTPLKVTGIVENYIYNYVYVGKDAYKAAFSQDPTFDHLYANVGGGESEHQAIMEDLHGRDGTDTLVFNDETIKSYRSMMSTVDQVMMILVISAAMLAFIVLYNLTNINISERVREIASLRVLGFTHREVEIYVFRETLLLTLLGALIGLVGGYFMEQFVIVTVEVDLVMFGRTIHTISYFQALGITMVFALIVMAALTPKLRRIDMVESLKSVD